MKQFFLIREDPYLPTKCHRLRGYGCQRSPSDAPAEPPHEGYHQQDVHTHRKQRGIHGMARFACSSEHGIRTEVHVRHHVTQQDHNHKLPGIGQCGVRSTEESEDRIEEQQREHHKREADDQVQRHRITQQVLGYTIVFLTQFHADARRGTHAHSRTEGSTQVHKGECDAKTSDSFRTHNLSDHGTVDDIIEARCRHGDNGGQGILPKQLSYRFLSQFKRSLFVVCHAYTLKTVQRYDYFSRKHKLIWIFTRLFVPLQP